jgi:signal transduction histidine kinase/DNA-binding response OmpR family regulator
MNNLKASGQLLLVEDEPAIGMPLRDILLAEGYGVVLATSGREALLQMAQTSFDLILTDLRLGDVSGIDVLTASQRLWPTPVTIVLTAYASLDTAIQALHNGAYSYLIKPPHIEELKLMIRRGIERKRLAEMEILYQVAQQFTSTLDRERVFKQVVESACWITGFPFGCLALQEDAGLVVAAGGAENPLGQSVTPSVQSLIADEAYGPRLARGEPVVYPQDIVPGSPCHVLAEARGVKQFIAVPLTYLGQLEGVLYVEEIREGQPVLLAALRLIQGLGYHASLAVAHARVLAKLEAANQELKTLDEAKSNLLSTVTHELKTPMVAVKGYTTLMLRQKAGPLTPKQREYLDIALKNINRQLSLIDELLNSMKIAIYRQPLRIADADLRDLIEEVVELIGPEAQRKRITVSHSFDREAYVVVGDREKLRQAFTNLLSNAVKFTPEGGRITVGGASTSPGMVEVTVCDTGIGIPEGALAKVFDPFFQVDSSTARQYGGVGLGLAITKEIIGAHGGTIGVKSRVSEGTAFTVRLPSTGLGDRRPPAGGPHAPVDGSYSR